MDTFGDTDTGASILTVTVVNKKYSKFILPTIKEKTLNICTFYKHRENTFCLWISRIKLTLCCWHVYLDILEWPNTKQKLLVHLPLSNLFWFTREHNAGCLLCRTSEPVTCLWVSWQLVIVCIPDRTYCVTYILSLSVGILPE